MGVETSHIYSEGTKMTGIDDRKAGFEKKFAHDEELTFKATARRNKLVGLWAAGLMGITGDEADAYGKAIVIADFEEAGDDDVFRRLRDDLAAAGSDVSEHQIRREMDELMHEARAQIMNETD